MVKPGVYVLLKQIGQYVLVPYLFTKENFSTLDESTILNHCTMIHSIFDIITSIYVCFALI